MAISTSSFQPLSKFFDGWWLNKQTQCILTIEFLDIYSSLYINIKYHILTSLQLLLYLRFKCSIEAVVIYFFVLYEFIFRYSLLEIFRRNDVIVISDEIWSDLTLKGYTHIPSQSISEDARNRTIALYSTSKTFSLAGIVGSYHIIYNNYLRDRILKESSLCHYNDMNVLTMHALIGAYSNEGEEWVEELRSVLTDNVRYAVQYIREHFPGVNAAVPQGTYMLFADCREWCLKRGLTLKELEKQMWRVGVACQDGAAFGGEYSIRMNLALPKSRVEEAMKRLQKYVFTEG